MRPTALQPWAYDPNLQLARAADVVGGDIERVSFGRCTLGKSCLPQGSRRHRLQQPVVPLAWRMEGRDWAYDGDTACPYHYQQVRNAQT